MSHFSGLVVLTVLKDLIIQGSKLEVTEVVSVCKNDRKY